MHGNPFVLTKLCCCCTSIAAYHIARMINILLNLNRVSKNDALYSVQQKAITI